MKEEVKILNSKSKMLIAFCFCFIFGVTIFSVFNLPARGWSAFGGLILFFISLFLLIFFYKNKTPLNPPFVRGENRGVKIKFILLCLLFFVIGSARILITYPHASNHISKFYNQNLEITGVISKFPDEKISYTNYNFKPDNYAGNILLRLPLYPKYNYGDELGISCFLEKPENFSDSKFKYDKYLELENIFAVCNFSSVEKLGNNNKFFSFIFKMKNKVADKINTMWHEPEASLMAGLLYGARSGLPGDLTENFNRTGLTHIIAISGYNISIVVLIMSSFLIYIGFYRQQAFWITLLGIFIFVIFTGASASVVRAGIMGGLILLTRHIGRLSKSLSIIIFTVCLMLIFNPRVLIWDAGFQLSFLAVVGLIYLAPFISNKLKFIRSSFLIEVISATISANLLTLPLILYQFERLSLVSLPANILVLWLIPFIMMFGFAAVLIGLVFLPVASVIAWMTNLGLEYIIILTSFLGEQAWSSREVSLPLWMMITAYIFIFYFLIKKAKT